MGKDSGSRKKGGNKGILARHKEQLRKDAEERNERTKPENRRAYRETERVIVHAPGRVVVK